MVKRGNWVGLIAGNSRLHWARFQGDHLLETWDSEHLRSPLTIQPASASSPSSPHIDGKLYFASVVPTQNAYILAYPDAQEITLADIPINNLYPSLGIDRALALLGAGIRGGWPSLVIDGGTALTLTAADGQASLVGGAILPGVQLQFDSLGLGTAALPQLNSGEDLPTPERWARSTEGAIASGVLHSLASSLKDYIQDWKQQHPTSSLFLTGGAGTRLAAWLPPEPQRGWSKPIPVEPSLAAWGLQAATASYRESAHRA